MSPTIFTCNVVLTVLLRQACANLLSIHRFVTQASVATIVATHNLLLQAYCDCRHTNTALEHFCLTLPYIFMYIFTLPFVNYVVCLVDIWQCWQCLPSIGTYILICPTSKSCHYMLTIYKGSN